ncbi:Flp pilus assembly protein CpaB [Paremcibacter congregatus]|uniref:Flp pilus assembly protein CpaB n=1 Tax=Paremcibacter congregatus TaxID=2043170 RepID=A0A2G4YRB8_9PROT|nr:Flp pilus assembly protein CpaB [Paremcibacter congregatus]PHZ84871.1 Flp pilus assembly protein CpaB [Paremcibacter congregatus]QDE26155.1 Flp pilus assembly protein CpaB [Paremcibacter congregatus]
MNINIRSVVLIGVALVVAILTALLARSLISSPKEQTASTQEIITQVRESDMKILVAANNLSVGHFIKQEDMVWQSWPDESVHESYIQQDAEVTPESFLGAVLKTNIAAGEPILSGRLVKPGNRGFMAAVLPKGKRAISIRINATSGNAGFVFPGDRVDILLTHQIETSGTEKTARISETVLKNVRILAINQSTDNPTHTPAVGQTATLEVTPKEAEKVSLIKNMGELTLILRSLGPDENDVQQTAGDDRTITWDSEVSSQVSSGGGSVGPTGRNVSVKVFRGSSANSENVDFNKLLNKAIAQKQSANDDEESEE